MVFRVIHNFFKNILVIYNYVVDGNKITSNIFLLRTSFIYYF